MHRSRLSVEESISFIPISEPQAQGAVGGSTQKWVTTHIDMPSSVGFSSYPLKDVQFAGSSGVQEEGEGDEDLEKTLLLALTKINELRSQNDELKNALHETNLTIPVKLEQIKEALNTKHEAIVRQLKAKIVQLNEELSSRDTQAQKMKQQLSDPTAIFLDQHKLAEVIETNEELEKKIKRMQLEKEALIRKLEQSEQQRLRCVPETPLQMAQIVEVVGITQRHTCETLQLFFELERRSGGGDLDSVVVLRPWQMAWVMFQKPTVAARVLQRNSFVLSTCPINVSPVTTLLVSNCPAHLSIQNLEDYFQDQAMSCGGSLSKYFCDQASGEIFLQFNCNEVASQIFSRKHVLNMTTIHLTLVTDASREVIECTPEPDLVPTSVPQAEMFPVELEVEAKVENNLWQLTKRHMAGNLDTMRVQCGVRIREMMSSAEEDTILLQIIGRDPSTAHEELKNVLTTISDAMEEELIDIQMLSQPSSRIHEDIITVQKQFPDTAFIKYSEANRLISIFAIDKAYCDAAKADLEDALGLNAGFVGGNYQMSNASKASSYKEEESINVSLAQRPPKQINEVTLERGLHVRLCEGDITQMECDVIVNAANSMLLHGGGVARAIAQAAGNDLVKECQKYISNCGIRQVGDLVPTTAGNLKAKYVLHAIGPRWDRYRDVDKPKCCQDVLALFSNILRFCEKELNAKNVAIPGVSSGVFGVPRPIVAKAMYDAIVKFDEMRTTFSLEEVTFITIDAEMNNWLITTCIEKGNIDPLQYINKRAPKPAPRKTGICKTQ